MSHFTFEPSVQLEFIDQYHAMRGSAERYVAQRYELAFDAHIEQFMPVFLALTYQGEIRSLCGVRDAGREPLFLEQYLTTPVEKIIEDKMGLMVSRHELLEFGQLASFSKGVSPLHFYFIAHHLVSQGYRWCVCTVTDTLYALFKRLGLSPLEIGVAQAARIPTASQWGRYYEHQPRIVVGNLEQSLVCLEKHFDQKLTTARFQEVL